MTKKTYGPRVEARAKRLLEVLVKFANGELDENQTLDIRCNWLPEQNHRPKLMVKTRLNALVELTEKDKNGACLSKRQVSEALGRMEDYLKIFEDHRLKKQGVAEWHFSLTLWSKHISKNLTQFAQIWDEKRSPKSKQYQEQKSKPAAPPENLGELSAHLTQPILCPTHSDRDESSKVPNNLLRSGAIAFVGRELDLERLHQKLSLLKAGKTVVIVGMGGLGKTELALQYALEHKSDYLGGVCWFRGQGVDLGTQILAFAREQLDVTPPEELEWERQVAYCWRQFPEGNVLAIVDDIADYKEIKPYLPPAEARFRVLLTSRAKLGRGIEQFSLEVLSEISALELFEETIGKERVESELAQTKQLCEWLGYLPLGLELVGRYIERKPDLPLAQMQKRLEAKRLQAKALCRTEGDMTAQLGVAAAFELSWEILSLGAKRLGGLLSVFAAAPILWMWVEQCDLGVDPEELEETRDDRLLGWHLLRRMELGTYQLHPLIREFFQSKLEKIDSEGEFKRKVCQTLVNIARKIPQTPTQSQLEAVAVAMPHLAEVATVLVNGLENDKLILPFVGLGRFYEGQGSYEKALPWRKRCLSVVRDRVGQEHPDVARSLDNLASVYFQQGRYEEAESLYVEALEMRRKFLGKQHPMVAMTLHNLANICKSQRRYEEAESLYVEALEMRTKRLGSKHPDLVKNLNCLASLCKSQGRYEEAESLYIEALEMRTKLLGAEHPDLTKSLHSLANLYWYQGKYKEAEPLYVKALKMRRKLLGEKHADVATSLHGLALLYMSLGKYKEAEPLYIKALDIHRELLGSEHPEVAGCLNNLAVLYTNQGRYEEAVPLCIEALEMWKKLFGQEHKDVAKSLNLLAKIYMSQGRNKEAVPLCIQALEMRKKLFGQEHEDVADNLKTLGAIYMSQGRDKEAISLCIQALEMIKKLLGSEHPEVADCLNNLAVLYTKQGRNEEAELIYVEVLRILERVFGIEHQYAVRCRQNIKALRNQSEKSD